MKSRPIALLPLYVCVLLIVACLATAPAVLASPGNTANCGGGRTVSCSAYRCVCIDNTGCTGYDTSGKKVEDNPCPAVNELPVIGLEDSDS